MTPVDRTELLAARQAGAAGLEQGAEVTLSLVPCHARDCLCELLMDWIVFVIDSPENKCLHTHKSSTDFYSPSANRRLRGFGMGWQAHSSPPLPASSVAGSGGWDLLLQVHGAVQLGGHRCCGWSGHRGTSDLGVHKCGVRARRLK